MLKGNTCEGEMVGSSVIGIDVMCVGLFSKLHDSRDLIALLTWIFDSKSLSSSVCNSLDFVSNALHCCSADANWIFKNGIKKTEIYQIAIAQIY